MATTTSITTTYAGEHSGDFISAALLSANTIAQGGVTVKPNIKFKQVVSKLSTDGLLKDGSCDFTATSTITKTERTLEPKSLQVNTQLCKADFRDDWQAISMGYSSFDVLPKTFADYLIGYMVSKVAEANEIALWQGDTSVSGEFDGFTTLLAADAAHTGASKITGIAIDASNVIDELGKIVDAILPQNYGKEDLHIYISQNIYRSYVRALGGFGANGVGANGYKGEGNNQAMGDLMFDGVKLFCANGLPNTTAICAEKSNLFFGCGLLNDANQVKVLDMADLDGSENVRFVMRMTAAVQYGNVEDIISYGL